MPQIYHYRAPRGEICPIPIARLQDQQGILDEEQGGQIEKNVNWSKTVDYIAELERQNAAEPALPASRSDRTDEVTVFIRTLNNRMAFIGAAFDDCRRRLGVQNVAVGRSRRAVKGTKFSEMEHFPFIDLSNFKKLSAIYKGRFLPPYESTADRGTFGPFKLIEDKKEFGSFIAATNHMADFLAKITQHNSKMYTDAALKKVTYSTAVSRFIHRNVTFVKKGQEPADVLFKVPVRAEAWHISKPTAGAKRGRRGAYSAKRTKRARTENGKVPNSQETQGDGAGGSGNGNGSDSGNGNGNGNDNNKDEDEDENENKYKFKEAFSDEEGFRAEEYEDVDDERAATPAAANCDVGKKFYEYI
ncbi:hypothetical protein DL768_010680 [Monosporascus sp. mg162]|nr:hypothetical protein DL768_010680 [Monosporascus sp. mg162]